MKPNEPIDTANIPGWGVDADPENDPTYPYRSRTKDDHSGTWTRPSRQEANVEILQSIEHKQRPAVVGSSTPPSGLSGSMRRLAFRKSESNLLHWMGLLGADRINVAEGVLHDLRHARVPNIAGEMGMRAEWQFNKRGVMIKAVVLIGVIAIIGTAVGATSRRKYDRRR
jgi:hypothetical protein